MASQENIVKRPNETDFYQQTLQSWNPIILMGTVFPFFAGIGTVFILIGVALLLVSMSVDEINLDYTYCRRFIGHNSTGDLCSEIINNNSTSNFQTCQCIIHFDIKNKVMGQVFLYYSLKNFYQNHRRYLKSKDINQLFGRQKKDVTSDCEPYGTVKNGSTNLVYAPCGIIANSLFNDTYQLHFIDNGTETPVSMTSEGIAWKVDTDILYGRPQNWDNTLKPVNWPKTALQRNNDSYKGDEELLVWMRTSSFSTFKKLHRIINHDRAPFTSGLPQGKYRLTIDYAYPVTMFDGRKSVVLSTTNGMGGKNNYIGIMYIVVGAVQLIIAVAFAMHTYLRTNPKEIGRREIKMRLMNGHLLYS